MANPIEQRKCPNCGAPLRFDAAAGMLLCDFCDSSFTVEQADAAEGSHSVEESAGAVEAANQKLGVYVCQSCGAEVIADPEKVALSCPYCGNNIVLTDKLIGKMKPDGIIPFRITPEKLPQAVRNYYKGQRLIPKRFFSDSSIGTVTGIYVPFWLYSSSVGGDVAYSGTIVREYREGDYRCQDISYYRLERSIRASFEDIPADASAKLDDALMDSLEPYDYSEIKAFDTAYLAGYTADRYDIEAAEVRERAEKRMTNTVLSEVLPMSTAGFGSVELQENGLKMDGSKVRYVLLPAYLFDISYGGKQYSFAVNGQSGKVIGEVPTDKSLKRWAFWKYFLTVGLGLTALSLLRLLLF